MQDSTTEYALFQAPTSRARSYVSTRMLSGRHEEVDPYFLRAGLGQAQRTPLRTLEVPLLDSTAPSARVVELTPQGRSGANARVVHRAWDLSRDASRSRQSSSEHTHRQLRRGGRDPIFDDDDSSDDEAPDPFDRLLEDQPRRRTTVSAPLTVNIAGNTPAPNQSQLLSTPEPSGDYPKSLDLNRSMVTSSVTESPVLKPVAMEEEEREEVELHEIDVSGLQEVKHMSEFILKPRSLIRASSFLHAFELFVSVTTIVQIMSLLKSQYADDVTFTWFPAVMDVLTFIPIACFFQFYTLFNNYYAQLVYYHLLARGVILDFANTATLKYFSTHWAPLLYLISLACYAIFTLGVLIAAGVDWHEIFVFCENVAVGMLLFWYRQQGVEGRLVSLSQFTEAFEDANAEFHNIDATSLNHASRMIRKLVVAKSMDPTYTNAFRIYWFRLKRYSKLKWVCYDALVAVAILVTFGLALLYYYINSGHSTVALNGSVAWSNAIEPCVQVCLRTLFSSTGGPDVQSALVLGASCDDCLCKCVAAVGHTYLKYCSKFITGFHWCNATAECDLMSARCALNGTLL